ncbi:hypothetical protein [Candidatus Poriferisodalis sp.]|uniref:hypothetical protein n=1 Tax=Candidatus Poriferisodalis sp. TaxID=3101277 RepID=UPI003B5AFA57
MATEQIAVRLPASLLSELDELVHSGAYRSRAAAVRAGIKIIAEIERRQLVDQTIVDGYERCPPTEAEDQAAWNSLKASILEEPW